MLETGLNFPLSGIGSCWENLDRGLDSSKEEAISTFRTVSNRLKLRIKLASSEVV